MAIGLIDFDGCGDLDHGAPLWSESSGGSPAVSTAYGTFGGYGFWNTSGVSRFLPGNYSNLIMGCHVNVRGDGPQAGQSIHFCENGITHVQVAMIYGEQRLRVYLGPASTLIGMSDVGSFQQLVWGYLEAQIVVHDTAGSVTLWAYGSSTPLFQATGIDTKNAGVTGQINNIKLRNSTNYGGDGFGTVWYDDMYWVDGSVVGATRLGPCRVTARRPNADATPLEWDPSTGLTHFNLVNESPFSPLQWVQTNVNGEKDMYATADDGVSFNVHGVRVVGQIRKNDVAPAQARLIIKDGANYGNGNIRNLSDTSVAVGDVFPDRPAGGGAWDNASVDSLLIGVEKVT